MDIASNTGERSEMDIDKLQDLLTVASGFQSLIYNIKSGEKYAYDDLLRQLETVWKALKQTQNLSKLLVSCVWLVRFVFVFEAYSIFCRKTYGSSPSNLNSRSNAMEIVTGTIK